MASKTVPPKAAPAPVLTLPVSSRGSKEKDDKAVPPVKGNVSILEVEKEKSGEKERTPTKRRLSENGSGKVAAQRLSDVGLKTDGVAPAPAKITASKSSTAEPNVKAPAEKLIVAHLAGQRAKLTTEKPSDKAGNTTPSPEKQPTDKAGTASGKEKEPKEVKEKEPKEVKEREPKEKEPKEVKEVKESRMMKAPLSPKLMPTGILNRGRSRSPRRDLEIDIEPPQLLPSTKSRSDGLTLVANHFGMQGKRQEMEDEHISISLSYQPFEHLGVHATPTCPLMLHAVFDGHTGSECAKFAAKRLPSRLREKLDTYNRRSTQLTIRHLLIFTLEDLDREFMEAHPTSDAGCTAVVCLIDTVQKMLYCANIGDSRAIIGRKLNHLALTRDQDGSNIAEAKRVEGSGGTIDSDGYINDTVNMTRSLGDRSGKFKEINGYFSRNYAIVSAPEVRIVQLTDTHMFLLLACDGMFEVFTSQQIIVRARQLLTEGTPKFEEINSNAVKAVAKTLCKEAIDKGSTDNVSVMIVCFC